MSFSPKQMNGFVEIWALLLFSLIAALLTSFAVQARQQFQLISSAKKMLEVKAMVSNSWNPQVNVKASGHQKSQYLVGEIEQQNTVRDTSYQRKLTFRIKQHEGLFEPSWSYLFRHLPLASPHSVSANSLIAPGIWLNEGTKVVSPLRVVGSSKSIVYLVGRKDLHFQAPIVLNCIKGPCFFVILSRGSLVIQRLITQGHEKMGVKLISTRDSVSLAQNLSLEATCATKSQSTTRLRVSFAAVGTIHLGDIKLGENQILGCPLGLSGPAWPESTPLGTYGFRIVS